MRSTKRQLSPKLKFQIVVEALAGTKTPGQIAKLYGVHPNSVRPVAKDLPGPGAGDLCSRRGRQRV